MCAPRVDHVGLDRSALHNVPAPKRSRSLVDNFRRIILPHTTPPCIVQSLVTVPPAPTLSSTSTPSSPSQRRRQASIRRRSCSPPFISSDILDPVRILVTTPSGSTTHGRATVSKPLGPLCLCNVEEPSAVSPASSSQPTPISNPRWSLLVTSSSSFSESVKSDL
jgi:hypothetical protein